MEGVYRGGVRGVERREVRKPGFGMSNNIILKIKKSNRQTDKHNSQIKINKGTNKNVQGQVHILNSWWDEFKDPASPEYRSLKGTLK